MKKIVIGLLVMCMLAFYGCSTNESPQYKNGYEIASFEKFNSYAEDNGLDLSKVTIQGTVKSVFDFADMSEFSIVTEDEGRWLVPLIGVKYSKELDVLFDEKNVTIYGIYNGYSDIFLMPVIYAELIVLDGEEYYLDDLPFYQDSSESVTEPPTEIPTQEPAQPPQIVLYENNGIKVSYKNITHDSSKTNVNLLIENNSGRDYCIQTRNMSVNGFMLDPIFSPNVTAGNKANDAFTFYNSRLKENDITEINHLEFSFYIFDWNDRDSVIETDSISFDIK